MPGCFVTKRNRTRLLTFIDDWRTRVVYVEPITRL